MLNVILLNVIMLNVIVLNVIRLNAVVPKDVKSLCNTNKCLWGALLNRLKEQIFENKNNCVLNTFFCFNLSVVFNNTFLFNESKLFVIS